MKQLFNIIALAVCLGVNSSSADTVVREAPDNTFGGVYAGTVGFLLGGAAGGPLGAFLAGGASWFAGKELQETAGLSGTAYEVEDNAGNVRTVRSPNRTWTPGDQVEVKGRRLVSK